MNGNQSTPSAGGSSEYTGRVTPFVRSIERASAISAARAALLADPMSDMHNPTGATYAGLRARRGAGDA